jgi:hypothetical protein
MAMKKQRTPQSNLTKNASQPHRGNGYQKPTHMKAETSGAKGGQFGYGVFTPPPATGADRFCGTKNKGVLRTSGIGHHIGCKK